MNSRLSSSPSPPLSRLALAAGVFIAPAQAKGCLKGALVGGVAGHYAGHHAVAGAIGGCIVGHHMAAVTRRSRRKMQPPADAGADADRIRRTRSASRLAV